VYLFPGSYLQNYEVDKLGFPHKTLGLQCQFLHASSIVPIVTPVATPLAVPVATLVATPIVVPITTLVAVPTPVAVPVVVNFFVKYWD
jgi:hypothetical protein